MSDISDSVALTKKDDINPGPTLPKQLGWSEPFRCLTNSGQANKQLYFSAIWHSYLLQDELRFAVRLWKKGGALGHK
jgi:hypothetical protein